MLIKISQHEEQQRELTALESQLLNKKLNYQADVQRLLKWAYGTWNIDVYDLAISRLNLILKSHNTQQMRTPDEFRPYCPESLSRSGELYLLEQIDNLPIYIDLHKFLTGLALFGAQGSGKSREIIHLCSEIRRIAPDIKITIVDPKGGFSNLDSFSHIDITDASFDLMSPSNISIENFIYELMPILANSLGLVYALDMLYRAADIAFEWRRNYIEKTNIDPGLCLRDTYDALTTIKVSGFRPNGYHDAAVTATSFVLGKQNLFSCRKGISLDWLFNQNVVLNARCLTNEWQCRFFGLYLLYWLYQRSRFEPETNRIKHIIIVDDATRFIGAVGNQFDGHSKTSPLGHLLAVLRSAGVCLVYATQLPSQVDPSILSLTRNVLAIGNINGNEHLRVIQNIMSLTDAQLYSLPAFKKREVLAFISGSDWAYPVHGWAPKVEIENYTTANPTKAAVDITPWHSLTEIPQQAVVETTKPSAPSSDPQHIEPTQSDALISSNSSKVSTSTDKLVIDCIHYPFDKARDHAQKMDSFREYDAAKTEAVQNGLLISSQCGKALYLIPTQIAYDKFGVINPYQRATSVEHAFYVSMAAHYLKQLGLKVQIETPVGSKGATIDVTTVDKSGNMTAYEITFSTSNLSSNASKLQDTAYKNIIWLYRDADTAKAVMGYFNKLRSLPLELIAKFKYIHFGKWSSQMEKVKE